jgi:hypothetical protein
MPSGLDEVEEHNLLIMTLRLRGFKLLSRRAGPLDKVDKVSEWKTEVPRNGTRPFRFGS